MIARALRLTPQARKVLAHLRTWHWIDPREALLTYSVARLAARIHEIREQGFIVKTWYRRDAEGKPYARYYYAELAQ